MAPVDVGTCGRTLRVGWRATCIRKAAQTQLRWGLCLNGMGSGPPKAAALLNIDSYRRALVFRTAFAKALGRGYSIYDLICFLCLAVVELRKEVAASRRRAVSKGIHRRGDRYLVQWYDGKRFRYI